MKPVIAALFVVLGLSACGVDGEPSKPEISARTTVGVNSGSGGYTDTELNIHIPLN